MKSLVEDSVNRRLYLQNKIDLSLFDMISGPLHLIAITPKNFDNDFADTWSLQSRDRLLAQKFMLSRPLYEGRRYLKVVLGK